MSERSWHHYFHGVGIDMAKVHDEANTFLTDYKSPRSSIVHDHPYEVPCDDKDHTAYDHITGSTIPFKAEPEILHSMKDIREAIEYGEVVNKEPMGNGLRREREPR